MAPDTGGQTSAVAPEVIGRSRYRQGPTRSFAASRSRGWPNISTSAPAYVARCEHLAELPTGDRLGSALRRRAADARQRERRPVVRTGRSGGAPADARLSNAFNRLSPNGRFEFDFGKRAGG